MQSLSLQRSATNKSKFLSVKSYYTASTIHKSPARYTPNKHFSYQSLPHIPISFSEGRMLLFSEVFTNSVHLSNPHPRTRAKDLTKSRPTDFFYDLLRVQVPTLDSSLQDLLCIAELGIPEGDRRKEATIFLALGDKYDEIQKSLSALKFYQRSLKANKFLGDKAGQSAALNRIGITYYNRGNFALAKKHHRKHKKLCPADFVPIYNLGVVNRAMKLFVSSTRCLNRALEIANESGNNEEMCIATAQLGLTYKAANQLEIATQKTTEALIKAKEIKASGIIVELKMALAYLNFHQGNTKESEKYFYSSMLCAIGSKSEICRVNTGILRGEEQLRLRFTMYT